MPIYEYRCPQCRHLFEAIRPMGDDGSELDCPECGRRGPELVPSVFGTSSGATSSGGGGCAPSSGFS
jgi:putative FmdB family regulatory protein